MSGSMSGSSDAFERGEVTLPQHLALIMDGNGRWANAQGAERAEGHRVGSEVVNQIVRCCRRWGSSLRRRSCSRIP